MTKMEKEAEIQKAKAEKNKVAIEWRNIIRVEDEEEGSSPSSMYMYSLDSDKKIHMFHLIDLLL